MSFAALCFNNAHADTIPDATEPCPLQWSVGAEIAPAFVPGTNNFLRGDNVKGKSVDASFASLLRADFSFNPRSRTGRLYPGLYQGIGLGIGTFSGGVLGTPFSAYVYQGAPLVHFSSKLWLGYEWQFGAAFGWKHYRSGVDEDNGAVSTSVTARMGISVRLCYELSRQWQLSAGVNATHYSNGNTSYPNAGVNTVGATIGIAYILNPQYDTAAGNTVPDAEADAGKWFFDIMAYGAWRRRGVNVRDGAVMCPGRFGVAGVQLAPMRQFNRWLAAGVALDMQYDESAGLAPYWVESSMMDDAKFYRPPFGKQISVGFSAHAEFTMPIFVIDAGLGCNIVNPDGDRRFYQSLTLKTFITKNLYINTGYRLGSFKDPQNLMLGLGVRL